LTQSHLELIILHRQNKHTGKTNTHTHTHTHILGWYIHQNKSILSDMRETGGDK